MTDKPTYPTVSDASLVPFKALEAQLAQFPDLFSRPDCPYPTTISEYLARILGAEGGQAAFTDDDLVTETVKLFRELQKTLGTMKTTDAKDQMAVFKTQGELLGKLVSLREKALNIREMGRFQKATVEVLESVITPAQRAEFLEKLGNYIDV